MSAHFRNHTEFSEQDLRTVTPQRPGAKGNSSGTSKMRFGSRSSRAASAGFTLIEMLVSVTVLSVIMGGVVAAISTAEQTFTRTEQKTDMYENVRAVAELMAQEVGQAGLVSLPATTTSAAIAANAAAQAVTVSSTTSMYVGEQVLVAGTNEELVTITALSSTQMSGIFTKAHVSGVAITALGSFVSGVMPTGVTDGSTANILNLFGDINGDGTLVYVRYTCTPGTSASPGTLTRSVNTITPGSNAIGTSQTLLSTVVGGTGLACFSISTTSATVNSIAYTFVTSVGFTVSVQSTAPDPQTKAYGQMTKSFLNLSPRNVAAGLEQAQNSISNRLQASPPNVASY